MDAHPTAESVFRRLVQEYPDNAKAATWNLRIGLALYLQQKYLEAINWLGTTSSHMSDKTQLAEAFHIIGASQFELKQDADAISNLRQSISTDPQLAASRRDTDDFITRSTTRRPD